MTVFMAMPWAACNKSRSAVVASQLPRAVKPVSAKPATSLSDSSVRLTGEVNRGDRFKAPVGSNMFFALEPYTGNDSGWTIRLQPGSDRKSASIDCIGAVSEPLHGSNNVSIEPPNLSQTAVKWKPREFEFVPDAANCKVAWELMNLVYYPSKLSDEQRAEAGEKLGKIPTGHGRFAVIDSVLRPAKDANDTNAIEWLKFEIELSVPAVAQSPTPEQGKPENSGKAGEGIHGVDLQKFLNTRYLEVQPDLTYLKEECAEGQQPITEVGVQYGDLDGDGQEEAIYQGFTCMSGTAGVDFFGVVKMMPDGKIVALPIEGERKEFKGHHDLFHGLRGHLRLEIKNGHLVEIFPVYANENECNACASGGERDFVYRWDGHRFVLDDIIDISPDQSGT